MSVRLCVATHRVSPLEDGILYTHTGCYVLHTHTMALMPHTHTRWCASHTHRIVCVTHTHTTQDSGAQTQMRRMRCYELEDGVGYKHTSNTLVTNTHTTRSLQTHIRHTTYRSADPYATHRWSRAEGGMRHIHGG